MSWARDHGMKIATKLNFGLGSGQKPPTVHLQRSARGMTHLVACHGFGAAFAPYSELPIGDRIARQGSIGKTIPLDRSPAESLRIAHSPMPHHEQNRLSQQSQS